MSWKSILFILTAILFLLVLSKNAEGAGSGPGYPYTGGDWVIPAPGVTELHGEEVNITGTTVTVEGGATLHLYDGATVNFTLPDSVLDIKGNLTVENSTIRSESSLIHFDQTGENGAVNMEGAELYDFGEYINIENSSYISNSSFYGERIERMEPLMFMWADNVTVYGNHFYNYTRRLAGIGNANITISENSWYSCDWHNHFPENVGYIEGWGTLNNTNIDQGTYYDYWWVNVQVLDTFRQAIPSADVYIYKDVTDLQHTLETNDAGFTEYRWIGEHWGSTDIVVSKTGNQETTSYSITANQTISIILDQYEVSTGVNVQMINNYNKQVIPFGSLLCYLNDQLIYKAEQTVSQRNTEWANITIKDHWNRTVATSNNALNFSNETHDYLIYVNYVTIIILQYNQDTMQHGVFVEEFFLTPTGSDISMHFFGTHVAVPKIEDNNNYTLQWNSNANFTNGSHQIRNVTANYALTRSQSGYMITNVSVKQKGDMEQVSKGYGDAWDRLLNSEWWAQEVVRSSWFITISGILTVFGAIFLIKRLNEMKKLEKKRRNKQ